MMKKAYAAFDFGASSGRLVLGILEDGKMTLEEVHRFKNEPVEMDGTMYWDFLRLFYEMKQGLKKVARRQDLTLESIGIDTWGVDGAWIDEQGRMINNPVHYRDSRTKKITSKVHKKISEEKLYDLTGVQPQEFNTVYQLYYDKNYVPVIKNCGKSWLFMPDLFGFMLTGNMYNEYSIASTGGLIDIENGTYSKEIFDVLGLDLKCMQQLVMPGTVVGTLRSELQEALGLGDVKVVAVGSHDTASAVAATPLESSKEAYLVCGTWCLMGLERKEAIKTVEAKNAKLTNELGIDQTVRLLKNINGLWLLQQLKAGWNEQGQDIDFPDMIEEVKQCVHTYAINPSDERFNKPLSIEEEIVKACEETYGITLTTVGEIAKAAYNGLVNLYKETINELETITGEELEVIRMIGGGVKDQYLCEQVAQVTKKKVVAGPIEASCIGNILLQMIGTGAIQDINEGRGIVRESFQYTTY